VREHVELGYEGDELDECREYIQEFDKAYRIVSRSMRRRWWEFWK
jgi:hypothetical protein